MKIGILIIATGKYHVFVPPLLASIEKYFFTNHDLILYLFSETDFIDRTKIDRTKIVHISTVHEPFPLCTLHRYRRFSDAADLIDTDYLFYCDADMLFVDKVDEEILPNLSEQLTVVRHPGYWKGGWGSPNTDIKSKAWLPQNKRINYFCGGFNGGETNAFLSMSGELARNIENDSQNGAMAEWHDETHLNWFMAHKYPKILTPSYCYPENWKLPFKPKLLALDKNHSEIRS